MSSLFAGSRSSVSTSGRPAAALALAVAALSVSLASSSALAQATWTGATSSDWNDASNWSATPAGNLTVNNTANAGVYPTLGATSLFTPVDLFIGSGAGVSGRLEHTSGQLSLANTSTTGNWMFVGQTGGNGTYNLSGDGSLAVGKLFVGGRFFEDATNSTGTTTVNTTGSITANSTDQFGFPGQQAASIVVGWGGSGGGNSSVGNLNLQAGTVNANGAAIFVGGWGGNGTVTQTGGTLNVLNTLSVARWFGTGKISVENGAVNAGAVTLAHAGAANDLISATMDVKSGGTVKSEGDLTVAFAGSATGAGGTLNVAAGGTVNVGTTTERWMIVNMFDTVKGAVNVDGGTINLNANTDLRFSAGNASAVGTSVVNLNGGAITSYSGNGTGSLTSGDLDLNRAGGATANNTFNLNGGTLTIRAVVTTSNNGTAVLNFNGGTLKAANTNEPNFVNLGGANQRANVRNGGAVVDTNGYDVTIAQALLHSDIGGDNAADGGLTKNGLGSLALTGVNTYTGNTTVSAGTLALADNAGLKFVVGASGVNNTVTGTGAVTLDGDFTIDLSAASTSPGSAWTLVNVDGLAETFGATFQVNDFVADAGGVLWTKAIDANRNYQFSEATGVLSVAAIAATPEPATLGATFGVGSLLLARRRRSR